MVRYAVAIVSIVAGDPVINGLIMISSPLMMASYYNKEVGPMANR